MSKTKKDFINLHQQKHQSMQDYYESFISLKEVNETLNTNIHNDLGFNEAIAREKDKDPTPLSAEEKTNYMEQG
jgi:hypothetical protein